MPPRAQCGEPDGATLVPWHATEHGASPPVGHTAAGNTSCGCAEGYYVSGSACVPCAADTWSEAGAHGNACTSCGAGSVGNPEKTQCTLCPAGQFENSGSKACEACGTDTFAAAKDG